MRHSVVLFRSQDSSATSGFNVNPSTVSGGPYNKLTSAPDTNTSYTDSTVTTGTYYYVVTALGANNVESAYSTPVSIAVP